MRSSPSSDPVAVQHPAEFTGLAAARRWVDSFADLARPDDVVWWEGGAGQTASLVDRMVRSGSLIRLNPESRPNSFLARSDPSDVARVEDRTFICSRRQEDAGPSNNWRPPVAMRAELTARFSSSMRGRTMYVVPFSMGPVGGSTSSMGIQLTDSPYAVLSMDIMTRAGSGVLDAMTERTRWVPAVHTLGAPLVDPLGQRSRDVPWPSNPVKVIAHFPETREIWSYGSGYGGNALLAKKCFALRIASVIARDEGWLAEHMLLIRVVAPSGKRYHVAAAFPSACGKTNLAMLSPTLAGWRVETFGDDIAWLRPGPDGRLWASNPETGFFGVAPGTGESTNPNAMHTLWGNTIFTNVALRDDGDVWWEGMTDDVPARLTDWRGEDWTARSGRPAAHPNARFTAPAEQCPTIADDWEDPSGVPLDAIVFGGRRGTTVPLVCEADDWTDGVFLGATISSEQTAAAEGPVGALRFDPFAMQPFCGYNMADHWQHWLDVGDVLGDAAPRVFRVNWFRKDDDGGFVWPGFGDNIRALKWIVERLEGTGGAMTTPIGGLPRLEDLDLDGLALHPDAGARIIGYDVEEWREECDHIGRHFARFGERLPSRLAARLRLMRQQLAEVAG